MKPRRTLQTILFTDIVGSTERAAELGDRSWRELQERHHRVVRQEIRRWGGHEVNEAGDGFLVLFGTPARALACADAIRGRLRALGLEIRCGMHMGQIERNPDGSAGGIAVHIAARVVELSGPGDIVVTGPVRDTESGSGFVFEDLGPRDLRGVGREWRLFRVAALPEGLADLAPGPWERLRRRASPAPLAAIAALVALAAATGYILLGSPGSGVAMASEIRSLAVLPLENLSGDTEQDYFSDGMTEALITELSKIGAIRVISRTSVMQYKGSTQALPDIARELGVTGIIEGSVMRAGDRARITAQLIHAGSDTHLWAQSYERDLADVLGLQSEVARAIAREIQVVVTPAEEVRLTAARPIDPEAYEDYLRGNFHLNQLTPEGIEKGLAYLHDAVEKDPAHPLPYAGLARGYTLIASHSPSPPADAFRRAQAAYSRTLELDQNQASAHAALAQRLLYRERDWRAAERSFRRAIELNPSLPEAHIHYAWYLNLVGRQEEAIAEGRRAVQVDPLTPLNAAWLAHLHSFGGNCGQALVEVRRVFELDPDFAWGYAVLGDAYACEGRFEEAIEAHEKAVAIDSGWRWALGYTYAQAGRADDARGIAAELEADINPLKALGLGLIYTALGETDEAFRWLEFQPSHPWLPWIRTWPGLAPIHDDPRFRGILDRMGLPPP